MLFENWITMSCIVMFWYSDYQEALKLEPNNEDIKKEIEKLETDVVSVPI